MKIIQFPLIGNSFVAAFLLFCLIGNLSGQSFVSIGEDEISLQNGYLSRILRFEEGKFISSGLFLTGNPRSYIGESADFSSEGFEQMIYIMYPQYIGDDSELTFLQPQLKEILFHPSADGSSTEIIQGIDEVNFNISKSAWAAIFYTNSTNALIVKPAKDFSIYAKLKLELRGNKGGELVSIILKDSEDPDDGTETRVPLILTN